mgnify:CR=1 FL=1
MTYKLAWRNLWRNQRRSLITMASIFFAVLLAIVTRSLQEGTYNQMIDNMVSFYSGYVQVHQRGYWEEQTLDHSLAEDPTLVEQVQAHPQVEHLIPRLESFALASYRDETAPAAVVGIDPDLERQLTHLPDKLVAGQYLDDSGGALLAEKLAEKMSLGVGDTVVLLGQGYHGVMAAGKYAVKGILSFGSPDLNQRMLYLPIAEAQLMYGADGRLTSYVLALKDPQRTPQVVADLQGQLDTAQYEVMDWRSMMPELVQTIEGDRAGGVVMVWVLYLIIGFGIFGTVLMMTTERKFEFGVLTAIGMKRGKLSLTVILESIIIAMLGVLAGALAALPITWYFQENPIYMGDEMAEMYADYGMDAVLPMVVDPALFLDQGITILIITLIISLYPLLKISRLKPVEAMKQ